MLRLERRNRRRDVPLERLYIVSNKSDILLSGIEKTPSINTRGQIYS